MCQALYKSMIKIFLKRFSIIFFLLISYLSFYAQNPPSVKWQQIETEHFTVVFPDYNLSQAKQTAVLLEKAFRLDTATYDVVPRKIPIFLFSQSVVSNAYARLAPRQMVWYSTPSSGVNLSITPWLELLAIHEYRHVVQYKALNKGFTKLNYYAFGQFGQLAMENFTVPSWFWEGDAVFNETFYTYSGRGRISEFDLHLRSLLLSDKQPKYMPFFFRSYKNYYPNHYYLGYYITSYINRHYGQDVWKKVLKRSAYFSFYPFIFSNSLRHYTGLSVRKAYYSAIYEMDSLWSEKYQNYNFDSVQVINTQKKRTWTNYSSPYFLNDSTIICVKSGLDDNPHLTLVFVNNSEKKLREIASAKISFAKNWAVWSQTQPDIRYTERNFSNIAFYNIHSGKPIQITTKQKLFSPDISQNAKIVAVEYLPNGITNLVILDTLGNILQKINSPENGFIRYPKWNKDATKIVFVNNTNSGNAIFIYDVKNKIFNQLTDYQWIRIKSPLFYKNYILFNFDPDGIANIYAIDTASKQIYKLTNSRFGIGDFNINEKGNLLVFNNYTYKGFDLGILNLDTLKFKKLDKIKFDRLNFFETQNFDNQTIRQVKINLDTSDLKPKKYNELKHLINFHSWILTPNIAQLSPPIVDNINFELYSANHLQTFNFIAGFNAYLYDNDFYGYGSFSYKKYFPIFDLELGYGKRAYYSTDIQDKVSYFYKNLSLGIRVPMNFSKGIRVKTLNISTKAQITQKTPEQNYSTNYYYFIQKTSISYENRRFLAYRDISSRHGFYVYGKEVYLTDLQTNNSGFETYVNFDIYLPSIFKHHSIILAFENLNFTDTFLLQTPVYSSLNLKGGKISVPYYNNATKLSFIYNFPIFYPDLGIYPLIYFKRLRGRFFAETLYHQTENSLYQNSDLGLQLLLDFHILHFNLFMFNIGVQFAYILPSGNYTIYPVFGDAVFYF